MDFTSYEDPTVELVVDLVNSLGSMSGTEYLGSPDELEAFLRSHEVTVRGSVGERDVAEVQALRQEMRAVFEAGSISAAAVILNRILARTSTLPQLTDHDGTWHFHFTSMDVPLVERLGAVCAMALGAALVKGGYERFGLCAAAGCRDVFVDSSRNRSRRYCSDTCATRMNVAAHRARAAD